MSFLSDLSFPPISLPLNSFSFSPCFHLSPASFPSFGYPSPVLLPPLPLFSPPPFLPFSPLHLPFASFFLLCFLTPLSFLSPPPSASLCLPASPFPSVILFFKFSFICFLFRVLARLHRLPVTASIRLKTALLTFKTLTTHQPSYIHDLLQPHCSSRQLRSASHNLLEIPRMRTDFAQGSFAYSAPRIGNSLPHVITTNLKVTASTLKRKLKTFYYTDCYP